MGLLDAYNISDFKAFFFTIEKDARQLLSIELRT